MAYPKAFLAGRRRHYTPAPPPSYKPRKWLWWIRTRVHLDFTGRGGMLFGGDATVVVGRVFSDSSNGGMKFGGDVVMTARLISVGNPVTYDEVTSAVPSVNPDAVAVVTPWEQP